MKKKAISLRAAEDIPQSSPQITFFLEDQDLERRRLRTCRKTAVLAVLAGTAFLLLIVLCLLTRTDNAHRMFQIMCVSMTGLGWVCIALYLLSVKPAQNTLRHLEGLAAEIPTCSKGRFFLLPETVQIPKSVRVRRVRLEGDPGAEILNLDEIWIQHAPADGTLVQVSTVHRFITGIGFLPESVPDGSDGNQALCPDSFPSRRLPPPESIWKKALRGFFTLFPPMLLWFMAVLIGGGFLFTRITDTSPAHKITIYIDGELQNAPQLAAELEKGLKAPIRMVKVHPFSYALFGSDAIRNADLYILPASHTEEYREWFALLPPEIKNSPLAESVCTPVHDPSETDSDSLSLTEIVSEGLPVYCPKNGLAVAGDYILYSRNSTEEPWFLFFGIHSSHLTNEDRSAVTTVQLLVSLP